MPLTQEQLDAFHREGYLRYGKVLDDADLAPLRQEYDRVFAEAQQSTRYNNLSAKAGSDAQQKAAASQQMLQITQMCERSIVFRRLLYNARILDIVQDLLGPNLMLFHDQALFKPARTGGPVPWHQDNAYWKCRPANLLSCWLALDDADRENGAMQVIPGSHLTPAWHAATQTVLIESKVDAAKAVVVDVPAGGCMFHHCQTLHYTQPNTTDRQRRAFVIHFMTPGTKASDGTVMHVGFNHPMLRGGG